MFKSNKKIFGSDLPTWLLATCLFFLLGIFSFGAQIFNIMLSGDGWYAFLHPDYQNSWTVVLGRYLSPLIWKLIGNNELANSFLYFYFFVSIWILFLLILSRTKYISPASVFVSSSIFLLTPSLIEMSAFQVDIPVRSTGIILLGIALYFAWDKDKSHPEENYQLYLNIQRASISVICLVACAASYQPIALMFVPGFLLISFFNKRLNLAHVVKGLVLCIISVVLYFLLWKLLRLYFSFGFFEFNYINENYDIRLQSSTSILQRLITVIENLIEFIILPKSEMSAAASIFLMLFSGWSVFIFMPNKKLRYKIVFTSIFLILLIGIIPTLIFIYKGAVTALRPQALIGMYFTPALLIGAALERTSLFSLRADRYFWFIVFFLIGIQSFQTSSVMTHKQAAYEKDIITGQAIISDLMDIAPNPSSIKVKILIGSLKSKLYTPNETYYTLPMSSRWTTTNNCHIFDCFPRHTVELLKMVAPPQVELNIEVINMNKREPISISEIYKIPLEQIPYWPNRDSIQVLDDDSLLLKLKDQRDRKFFTENKLIRKQLG
ncbi:MAG: hypothetical protein F6K16_25875 [Symploca sp. SIO2B6]|nr:hypothetical protein [Symploca sp. SIO2B6]